MAGKQTQRSPAALLAAERLSRAFRSPFRQIGVVRLFEQSRSGELQALNTLPYQRTRPALSVSRLCVQSTPVNGSYAAPFIRTPTACLSPRPRRCSLSACCNPIKSDNCGLGTGSVHAKECSECKDADLICHQMHLIPPAPASVASHQALF